MKAAFFDVDGTITRTNVWQGLMEYFRQRKVRRTTHLVFLAYHYPLYFLRLVGMVSEEFFRAQWSSHLGWYFRDYSIEDGKQIWDWVINEFVVHHWREDVLQLLEGHHQKGDLIVLVSGGPEPLLWRIATVLNVEHVVGTRFEIREDHYTGHTLGPACLGIQKKIATRAYLQRFGLKVNYENSFVYADALSDLSLLESVGNPVVVYPNKDLLLIAKDRGWEIYHPSEI
ncbi:MAG: HAD-IB family hydrolase [Anaerolineales bacterium]